MTDVTQEQLDRLRQMDSPTVANAIEVFEVMPRNEGFMSPEIKCMFPDMGTMVGYAVTAVIAGKDQPTEHMNVPRMKWFEEIQKVPEPRVLVMHDLDYPNPIGSFWGEVQSNIHRALGCIGVVTDGGVRDLDEMRGVDFHTFASEVLVSHAYVHLVDIGVPVTLGGMTVNQGDIVMGDQHGVVGVPADLAADIPSAADKVIAREKTIIDVVKSPSFTIDQLEEFYPN